MQNLLDPTAINPVSTNITPQDCEVLPVIEAILFTASRDVTLAELSEGLGIPDKTTVVKLVKQLMALYETRPSGLMIQETQPGTYEMGPKPDLLPQVAVFMRDDLLDPNELRTLALIAYKQPLTRAQLRKLRGNAPKHLSKLLDLKFIRFDHVDEEEVIFTTPKFADYFGLSPETMDIKEVLGAFMDIPGTD